MSNENQQNLFTDYRQLWQSESQSFEELVAESDQTWAEATATEESEAMAVFGNAALAVDYAALWQQGSAPGHATIGAAAPAGIVAGDHDLSENPSLNFKIRERGDDATPRRFAAGSFVIPKDGGCF